jgi:hypothetical protein
MIHNRPPQIPVNESVAPTSRCTDNRLEVSRANFNFIRPVIIAVNLFIASCWHAHRSPPWPLVQDDCEQIPSLPAFTATPFPPFSLVSFPLFNLWTKMIITNHNSTPLLVTNHFYFTVFDNFCTFGTALTCAFTYPGYIVFAFLSGFIPPFRPLDKGDQH